MSRHCLHAELSRQVYGKDLKVPMFLPQISDVTSIHLSSCARKLHATDGATDSALEYAQVRIQESLVVSLPLDRMPWLFVTVTHSTITGGLLSPKTNPRSSLLRSCQIYLASRSLSSARQQAVGQAPPVALPLPLRFEKF